jgi:release factor glutamine methyltransferase
MLVQDFIQLFQIELANSSTTPVLDAQVLLAFSLHKDRTWVISHSEESLETDQEQSLTNLLVRVKEGISIPYLIGKWYFYGLDFFINQSVLIPRPETELLVEKAITWLNIKQDKALGIDIGTGSGCIAISLATQIQNLSMIASDVSPAALQVARKNAFYHKVQSRIRFIQADLMPPIATRYDLICANLPYIPTSTLKHLQVFKREPGLSLNGGADGLQYIRPLLQIAPIYLHTHGLILLEIEANQGNVVHQLARKYFPQAVIETLHDFAGHPRLVSIQN